HRDGAYARHRLHACLGDRYGAGAGTGPRPLGRSRHRVCLAGDRDGAEAGARSWSAQSCAHGAPVHGEGRLTRWTPRLGALPRAIRVGAGRAIPGPAVVEHGTGRRGDRTSTVSAVAGFLFLAVILGLPGFWLARVSFPRLPIEALALAAILPTVRIFGARLRGRLLRVFALAVLVLFTLAMADALLDRTLGRGLDIPLDIHLAPALLEFTGDALGWRELWLWTGGALLVGVLVYAASVVALGALAEASGATVALCCVGAIVLTSSLGFALAAGRDGEEACLQSLPLDCHVSQVLARQVESASALWRPL